ncbi:MAG: YciC family protein [Yersinia sp. (in: enterobacteria)]
MPITANALYRDSFNFLRNQMPAILLLALLTAFVTVMLNQAFTPDNQQVNTLNTIENDLTSSGRNTSISEIVSQMTPEQQMVLLKVSAVATFSALVGNVLLIGGLLTLISMVSTGRRISALQAIGLSLPILPRLLLLIFISTLLIQLGLTMFIVPGVVLAVALSLSPVIITTERIGVFAAIKASTALAFANVRLIVPAMMLWITTKLILLYLVSHLTILPTTIATVVLSALSNLVSALLLVYLFRLYMLLRPRTSAVIDPAE